VLRERKAVARLALASFLVFSLYGAMGFGPFDRLSPKNWQAVQVKHGCKVTNN